MNTWKVLLLSRGFLEKPPVAYGIGSGYTYNVAMLANIRNSRGFGRERRYRSGLDARVKNKEVTTLMKGGKRILLVDDDPELLTLLADQLALHDDFQPARAQNGKAAIEACKGHAFDVIILDVGLPDMDGRDVCRIMRKGGVKSPIIMLTGADTDADAILGLDAGANDYVVKPFKMGVLLARVRAHIRQHERSDDAVFTIGPYTFTPSAKMLIDNHANKKIRLTDKEAAILKYLYRAGAQVVGRDKLLDEVWGYNAGVTTHTLETHVYRLRQKIESDPSNAALLVTDSGGYRLRP